MNQDRILQKMRSLSDPKRAFRSLGGFFGRSARFFTFLFALAVLVYCIYIWYATIYHSDWNESQKQSYMSQKDQGITFNNKIFDYGVNAVELRRAESQRRIENLTDIFRLKKQDSPQVENQPSDQPSDQPTSQL